MFSYKNIKNTMKDFKFPLGTTVVKTNKKHLDGLFGIKKSDVGIIVGYDDESDYYRVYYNDYNCYIGTNENEIEEYRGEISENLIKIKSEINLEYDFKIFIKNKNEYRYFNNHKYVFHDIQNEISLLESVNYAWILYKRRDLLWNEVVLKNSDITN